MEEYRRINIVKRSGDMVLKPRFKLSFLVYIYQRRLNLIDGVQHLILHVRVVILRLGRESEENSARFVTRTFILSEGKLFNSVKYIAIIYIVSLTTLQILLRHCCTGTIKRIRSLRYLIAKSQTFKSAFC